MQIHVMLQMIKDQMDKKFGSPWHVIVGKGFAYEITYEVSRSGTFHVKHKKWCFPWQAQELQMTDGCEPKKT